QGPVVGAAATGMSWRAYAGKALRETSEASTHLLGLASWNGFAQDGTVGDMDVDDEAPWTGSPRVPAWARPFRGAPHVRERLLRAQVALLRRVDVAEGTDEAPRALVRLVLRRLVAGPFGRALRTQFRAPCARFVAFRVQGLRHAGRAARVA